MSSLTMSTHEYPSFIGRLTRLTIEGKLRWSVADEEGFFFRSNTPSFRFILACRDGDDSFPFKLIVSLQDEERAFMEIEAETLEEEQYSASLRELYFVVKDQVLNISKNRAMLLRELDELD